MSIERLLRLSNATPACREYLVEALRWLNDPSKYGPFTPTPRRPRFSMRHFEQLKGVKFSPFYGVPQGFVDSFMHVEASKDAERPFRLRPINAPDANEGIPNESLQPIAMAHRTAIRQDGANKPELVVQFDMESCYDQYELGEKVRPFMCLLGFDGLVYALDRLPMGLRSACEVAQAALWFLLDFEYHKDVKISSYIDNIRFSGPCKQTTQAIRTFLARCRSAGVQLDRVPTTTSDADIQRLNEREGDFLGECYDYRDSTRRLTEKTVKKIRFVWEAIELSKPLTLSAQQFSTLMGLIFWSASVLSINLSTMFHLIRAYRQCASQASVASFSETAVTLNNTAQKELVSWFETALKNSKVPMVSPSGEPTLTIVTDASAVGYGAFACVKGSTEWKVLSGAWPHHILSKTTSSVFAEPEAIYLACLRFVRPEDRFVRIYTDHSPVVFADKAGLQKGSTRTSYYVV